MKTLDTLKAFIDFVLPDDKIIADIRKIFEVDTDGFINMNLEDGLIAIPENTPVFVVTKVFYKEYFDVPLATYKVLASFGSVQHSPSILESEFCFVTLHYNQDVQCFTSDIHKEFR